MDCSPPGSSVHGISGQDYWSGLPFPSSGDLPGPGIKPRSPALQADSLLSEPPEKAHRQLSPEEQVLWICRSQPCLLWIGFPEIRPPGAVSSSQCLGGCLGAIQGPVVPSGCEGITQSPSPVPMCSADDGAVHWPLTSVCYNLAPDRMGLSLRAGGNPSQCCLSLRCVMGRSEVVTVNADWWAWLRGRYLAWSAWQPVLVGEVVSVVYCLGQPRPRKTKDPVWSLGDRKETGTSQSPWPHLCRAVDLCFGGERGILEQSRL